MRLASRMERIGTETAFEAAARARALEATGRDVIHLEMGEPDFDTPRNVSERAARALLDEGATHYTAATGILPLREAIAADVQRWKGITASPDQVVVTPGAKPIMFYAMLALIEEGDEVIYPNPGFPIYESMARYVGGTAVAAPLREANDFRMDVDEVASLITPRTKLLITNSPHNPTGSILTDDRHRGASPSWPSSTTSSSSPTRSTCGSSTRASRSRSPPCRAWRSARSPSTDSARPSR